jgi:hypothetical protein
MPAYEGETQRLQPPCPLCGGTVFNWGKIRSGGNPALLTLEGDSFWSAMFGIGGVVRARVCDMCGNIQLFLEEVIEG